MKRRFVVQRHEVKPGETHFDLMLERSPGGALATFRLSGPLPGKPGETVSGEVSFDHRAIYLEFEGEISGGRGKVAIVARGEASDEEGDVDSPRFVVRLGEGRFELVRSAEKSVKLTRLD